MSLFLVVSPSTHVYSDASGRFGGGEFTNAIGWFQNQWPEPWREADIAVKELLSAVVAAVMWGQQVAWQTNCLPCR